MYPLLFRNILIEKVWGGRSLKNILNIDLPDKKKYGESWEISDVDGNYSVVQNGKLKGKSLHELIAEYGDTILGDGITHKFSNNFPLLIKYLDITDKLSIQVHPDDQQAHREGFPFGKHESWYFINASSDAAIIAGLKPGIPKSSVREITSPENIEKYFNIIPVRTGDFITIEPGTVHATFSGNILICEIQQNSDLTYRIYDFDREYHGKKRELHLEKGIETIKEQNTPDLVHCENAETVITNGTSVSKLTGNSYYSIEKIRVAGEYHDPVQKTFKVFSGISGKGLIISNGSEYDFSAGMTYLIPANTETVIKGGVELLKTSI